MLLKMDYELMTLKALKEHAKSLGITGYSKYTSATKHELVKLIEKEEKPKKKKTSKKVSPKLAPPKKSRKKKTPEIEAPQPSTPPFAQPLVSPVPTPQPSRSPTPQAVRPASPARIRQFVSTSTQPLTQITELSTLPIPAYTGPEIIETLDQKLEVMSLADQFHSRHAVLQALRTSDYSKLNKLYSYAQSSFLMSNLEKNIDQFLLDVQTLTKRTILSRKADTIYITDITLNDVIFMPSFRISNDLDKPLSVYGVLELVKNMEGWEPREEHTFSSDEDLMSRVKGSSVLFIDLETK